MSFDSATEKIQELYSLWLRHMEFLPSDIDDRKNNDDIEEMFWEKVAPTYSKNNNLNVKFPEIMEYIKSILKKENATILEIGAGSGNFTVSLAELASMITMIEPSKAMRKAALEHLKEYGTSNYIVYDTKIEEYHSNKKYDYVISINSLYRIKDIVEILNKMTEIREGLAIIIRSASMMPLYAVFEDLQIPYRHCIDYHIIFLLLNLLGFNPTYKVITANAIKEYASVKEVEEQIKKVSLIKNEKTYSKVLAKVLKQCDRRGDIIVYPFKTKFVCISW